MGASIDLRKAHLSRQHGDILAVLSWINDKRALFLIPALRQRAPWFIVMEEAAFEWNADDRENFTPKLTPWQRRKLEKLAGPVRQGFMAELAQSGLNARAAKACDVLGIEPSRINVHRIISIVNDALEDLVRMPSAPPVAQLPGSFGTLQVREAGRVMSATDIRLEEEGVRYG
jgi:hypothetical protein